MEANVVRQLMSTNPAELLIASIWQGMLLTALAWAALKLVPRLRATTRFTLWLIVFLLVAFLPCFAIGHEIFDARLPQFAAPTLAQAGFSLHLNMLWAFVIESLWLLASLFSLARLSASARQMRILSRNSTPIPFQLLDGEIQSIVARTGSQPVEVRLSDRVDAPSVIGFFHPAIVMPRSLWNGLAPDERKQIILHEIAHLNRGDDWTNLLQKLLRALCPLNPALFWAERHLCFERERACDDAVLDAAGNARSYATCLTKLAETKLIRRTTSLAPGMWKRRSELAGRVDSILDRRPHLSPLLSRGLIGASLLLFLSGVFALQRCPGIIIFAAGESATEALTTGPKALTGVEQTGCKTKYQAQKPARYQEAAFHSPVNEEKTGEWLSKSGVRTRVPAKAGAGAARNVRASARQLRFLELRDMEQLDGQGFTWILFTVESPQPSITIIDGDFSQPQSPTLSSSNHWIFFQI